MNNPHELDEDAGFLQRHRWAVSLSIGAAVVGAGYMAAQFKPAPVAPARAKQEMMICVFPPPPVPPTPPKPPEPKVEPAKMLVQDPTEIVNTPPVAPIPPEEPPALGTNNTGSGPSDSFALGAYKPGGIGNSRTIGGPPRKAGTPFGSYAAQVQSRIADAMRKSDRTRLARFSNVQAQIWVDSAGRIERAKVLGSNESPSDQDLIGLQLTSPSPDDMPMPIVLRLNARKPTT
jgi:hypothetical protein